MNLLLKTRAFSLLVAVFLVFTAGSLQAQGSSTQVNVLNYVQAKTALHFNRVVKRSGSVNS